MGFELAILEQGSQLRTRHERRVRYTHNTVKFVYGDVWQVQVTTLSDSATKRMRENQFTQLGKWALVAGNMLTPPKVGTTWGEDREAVVSERGADEGGEGGRKSGDRELHG